MAVHLMTWDFDLQAEFPHFVSLQLTRSYYGLGSFTLQVAQQARGADQLAIGRVIFLSNALHKAMLIEKVVTKDGKITASGKPLKGMAARRLCVPPTIDDGYFGWDRYIGSAEAAYHHYAAANLYNPEDEKRKVPRLVGGPNQDRGVSLPWQSRFGNLDALFADIGAVTGIGWDIVPDFGGRAYIFQAVEGRDLSTGPQKVVLSEGNRNANKVALTVDTTAQRTTAYVGGSGEDENRLILSEGNALEGLERREVWVDAGSIFATEMLALAGQKRLETAGEKRTLNAEILDSGLCRYERDYDVGDIVNLSGAGGHAATRLLEMRETYEAGGRKLDAIFGDEPITITSALRGVTPSAVR